MNKIENQIIKRIKAIENSTFLEDDIKLLLIEIRERLKKERFLTEICHFVAHSERDKGICHKKIDVRYAKFKFIEETTLSKLTTDFITKNKDKPESFFSDAMLSYIDTKKIEKNIFELIILAGIDDLENNMFIKYYKMSKKQVKKIIQNIYNLVDGHYILNEKVDGNNYKLVDDILKFIRGTITGKPAFSRYEIQNDFIRALKRLSKELNYTLNNRAIKENIDDVMLTIIALLQDAKFKLFDQTIGYAYLSIHPSKNGYEFVLMSKTDIISMPIIGTNLLAKKYIDINQSSLKEYELSQIPWTSINRNENGDIILTKNKAQHIV